MTILIDRNRDPKSLHVLIVGVGRYDGDEVDRLPTLDLMGAMVKRLYDWWRNEGQGRCLPGETIGTVEVLASDRESVVLRDDGDKDVEATLPGHDEVVRALSGWIDRVEAGGTGFLYWSGHGEGVGFEPSRPTTSLFCMDRDAAGRKRGIDWNQTRSAIDAYANRSGARISCFIDACRERQSESLRYQGGIETYPSGGAEDNPAFCLHTASDGHAAMSYAKPIPDAQFEGGPIGTHAIFDVVDRYGVARGKGNARNVTANRIVEAIKPRARRIGSRIAGLKSDWFTPIPVNFPGWGDQPLLQAPSPKAMVDLQPPPGKQPSEVNCEVFHLGTGAPVTIFAGKSVFEASLPYEAHEAFIWERLDKKKADRRKIDPIQPYETF